MIHSRFVVFVVMVLMFTAAGRAGELKVGFINSQEIFRDYKGTEDAQRKFDQEKQKLEQELEGKKQELDELTSDLERRSLLMSEETKKERIAELQKKEQEFQQLYFEAFGDGGTILRLNAELTQPIIEKMNNILDRMGSEEEFDIIFDVAPGGIVYAREGLDLTERVLDELNEMVKLPTEESSEDSQRESDQG